MVLCWSKVKGRIFDIFWCHFNSTINYDFWLARVCCLYYRIFVRSRTRLPKKNVDGKRHRSRWMTASAELMSRFFSIIIMICKSQGPLHDCLILKFIVNMHWNKFVIWSVIVYASAYMCLPDHSQEVLSRETSKMSIQQFSTYRWAQLLNWEDWSRKFKGQNRRGHRGSRIDVILVSMYPALSPQMTKRKVMSPKMRALHQLTTLCKSSLPGSSVLRNHGERAARPWTAALARHLRHVGYLVVWLVGFSNLVSPNRCHVLDSGEVWLGISEAISSKATWGFGFSRWSNNVEDELWWNGYVHSSKLWICLLERPIYVGSQLGGESRCTSHETRVSSQEGNFLVTVRKQLDKATAAFSSTSLGSRCTVTN